MCPPPQKKKLKVKMEVGERSVRIRLLLPSGTQCGLKVSLAVTTADFLGLVAKKAGMRRRHLVVRFRGKSLPQKSPMADCGFAGGGGFNDVIVGVLAASLAVRVDGDEIAQETVISRTKLGSYIVVRTPDSPASYHLYFKAEVAGAPTVLRLELRASGAEWGVYLTGSSAPAIAAGLLSVDAALQRGVTAGFTVGTRTHYIGSDPCPSCGPTQTDKRCEHCSGSGKVAMPPCGPPIGFGEPAALYQAAILAGSAVVDFAATFGPVLDPALRALFGERFTLEQALSAPHKWERLFGPLANTLRPKSWHVAALQANAGQAAPPEVVGGGRATHSDPATADALLTMLYQNALREVKERHPHRGMNPTPEHAHVAVLRGALRGIRHFHIRSSRASPENRSPLAVPTIAATVEQVASWLAYASGAAGIGLQAPATLGLLGRCGQIFYECGVDGRQLYRLVAAPARTPSERWWRAADSNRQALEEMGLKAQPAETLCRAIRAAAKQPLVVDAAAEPLSRDPPKPPLRTVLPPPGPHSSVFAVSPVWRPGRSTLVLTCTLRIPNVAPLLWGPADAYGNKHHSMETQALLGITRSRTLAVEAAASVARDDDDPRRETSIPVHRSTIVVESCTTTPVTFKITVGIERSAAQRGKRVRVFSGEGVPSSRVSETADPDDRTPPTIHLTVTVTEAGVPVMPASYYPAF